jgi:glyceraldehyde 3-phosphate dehydrogenase
MIKVAINGFGRIGRLAFRLLLEEENVEVKMINDLTDSKMLAHLLKYDTSEGILNKNISYNEKGIIVDNKLIDVYSKQDPTNLPYKEYDIDIVLECTGLFTTYEKAVNHIKAGAKKVIISAPSKDENIKTIVYNVNHENLNKNDNIISCASCTTNCLAPVLKLINDNYKINIGYMNTIHAYTNDQNLLDLPHKKGDLRRARAAASNIVPTSTGAASAIGKVITELDGRIDGSAYRVPVVSGSIIELTLELEKRVTEEEINELFKKNINETLGYNDEEIVSSDIIGIKQGSLFDSTLTKVITTEDKQLVKVSSWYDNEMSYTAQMIRTLKYLGELK